MDIRTALRQGAELLSSRADAEVLLAHAMRVDRVYFYAHPEQELREVEWIHYGRYLHERLKGKPIQYITRRQEFYGREFRVTADVLIPRPETELLVETGLKQAPRRVIDVGAGSGAIAVTIALESGAAVIATDYSRAALRVAALNARMLGAQVAFVECDLLTAFADGCADLIVSNPPYVAEEDRARLQPEVRDWEPALALFAAERGLAVYRRLLPQAWRALAPGGVLALELGFGQADAVRELASGWRSLRVYPDLAGVPRVLVCEKP